MLNCKHFYYKSLDPKFITVQFYKGFEFEIIFQVFNVFIMFLFNDANVILFYRINSQGFDCKLARTNFCFNSKWYCILVLN